MTPYVLTRTISDEDEKRAVLFNLEPGQVVSIDTDGLDLRVMATRTKVCNGVGVMNLRVMSKKLSTPEITDVINEWVFQYRRAQETYCNIPSSHFRYVKTKHQGVCPNESCKSNIVTTTASWSRRHLVTYKTFDNVFFDAKKTLVGHLRAFESGREMYERRGIPYTIGFLFHGPPGTGKTSTIKAMANMTKRHIVEVSLKGIRTNQEFIQVFQEQTLAGYFIPYDRRILVLEDIDCMGDVVKARCTDDDVVVAQDEEMEEDRLTLSCILNTIDGVLEQHGRILVITSNHPLLLDPALLRPGRIDMQVHFGYVTARSATDLLRCYFNDQKVAVHLPEGWQPKVNMTPAELIQKCQLFEDDVEGLLRTLL
jgi:hypothetical protein